MIKTISNFDLKKASRSISRYLNIPSNGSIRGSHASNCLLNVDAAIEQINTAFIVSSRP